MSLIANYHGTCSECSEDIVPGQRIEPDSEATNLDGYAPWQHVDCHAMAESAPCVCSRCWLVHNGECAW